MGFANWVKGWSEGKKQWCCKYGYKSCPNDAAAAGAGYGAGTEHGANFNGAQVAAIRDIPFAQARWCLSGAWPVSQLLLRAMAFLPTKGALTAAAIMQQSGSGSVDVRLLVQFFSMFD